MQQPDCLYYQDLRKKNPPQTQHSEAKLQKKKPPLSLSSSQNHFKNHVISRIIFYQPHIYQKGHCRHHKMRKLLITYTCHNSTASKKYHFQFKFCVNNQNEKSAKFKIYLLCRRCEMKNKIDLCTYVHLLYIHKYSPIMTRLKKFFITVKVWNTTTTTWSKIASTQPFVSNQ